MNYRTEWKVISDRIDGLLNAARFFFQIYQINTQDSYNTLGKELIPHAREISKVICHYQNKYASSLPSAITNSIKRFTADNGNLFSDNNINPLSGLQRMLTSLVSLRTEIVYYLSDKAAFSRMLAARAFIHLQRSIVADLSIKNRWEDAFKKGELACEKLGATHLLLHGIWAFKTSAEGERTDLVLGEPQNINQAELAAEALVLTEWKLVRKPNELTAKINEAYRQAERYKAGILAGFELAQYRYLVFVSEKQLNMPENKTEDDITYWHINIAVNPDPPSSH